VKRRLRELARDTSRIEKAVEFISDAELLALFPGRPLALIGPAGRQELVFPDQTLTQ
jgi:hypothetical protein